MSSYNNIYKPIQFTKLEAIDALNKSLTKKANKDIGKEIKEGDGDFSGNMRYDKFLQALEKLKRDGTYDTSSLSQSIENSGTTDNFWENLRQSTSLPTHNNSSTTSINITYNKNEWTTMMLDKYKKELERRNIDPSYARYLVALDAIESAWGKKPSGNNNYGGIKGNGKVLMTKEYINGKYVDMPQEFKNYSSIDDYIVDKINLLSNRRYHAFDGDFITNVVKGNYATSPSYKESLEQIVKQIEP